MSDPLTLLEQDVTDAFSNAITQFMQHYQINPKDIELIGLHGQTVYHRPELGFTRQLGDGRRMAAQLGITVVDQFRLADVQAGGGRHNQHFMQGLSRQLAVDVAPVESIGWDGDFLEAQCFGYLAVRSELGLPLSLPSTTGVKAPMTGGQIWPA